VISMPFEYSRATSLDDALARLAAANGNGKLIAGGHSLVPLMKLRLSEPQVLIDIARIPGLSGISAKDEAIEIGAGTVHHDVATSALLRNVCPMLAETAADIGDPQGFQGKTGMMPPKGGNPDLADVEVQRAVVYMANQSGGNLKEPPAPAAPAASTQTAAAGSVPAGSVGVATASGGAMTSQAAAPTSTAPGAPQSPTPAAAPGGATTVAAAAGAKPDGKKVFETTCNVCHGAGIAGAPKFGDKTAWAPRLAEGINVLHQHALQGYQGKSGVMPPKGGNTALSDAEVTAAVDYMAAAAK